MTRVGLDRYRRRLGGKELQPGVLAWVESRIKQVRGAIVAYRLAGDAPEPDREAAEEETPDGTDSEG